ncbi:Hsp20/alpha crystallin family protein [Cytobacillus oceanisediminis]|uniref:HSP20 family molecular chaperone IbpA n=1 Tax=Cytobacillus oceanisediminis TaxID=665099 RepID=A0A562K227_9BACI|nr:Hsp20/alpha crystallin family protein [Cytobacillus oceanisediminis]TWH89303.1 HSP20 family molecular chaperone IbpA [Cytobacillus oceanisediminis]
MFPWNLFPFNKDMKNLMQQMKPEEIDKYIQNIMGQMFPQNMQGMSGTPDFMKGFNTAAAGQKQPNPAALDSSVFETHDHVYVRMLIKKEDWLKDMKLYHTSNQMIIEHIPEKDDKHIITLPAIVKRKGSTAHFKDGFLEIKIPKNVDMQYSEIDVTEIL